MHRLLFPLHCAFVFIEFIVRDIIKGIFGIRCLVHRGIVLESTLDNALGGGTHHHHMIAGLRDGGILESASLIPCDALQNMGLWSGGNLVSSTIVLDLIWFLYIESS